jgi:hypothetical protein
VRGGGKTVQQHECRFLRVARLTVEQVNAVDLDGVVGRHNLLFGFAFWMDSNFLFLLRWLLCAETHNLSK